MRQPSLMTKPMKFQSHYPNIRHQAFAVICLFVHSVLSQNLNTYSEIEPIKSSSSRKLRIHHSNVSTENQTLSIVEGSTLKDVRYMSSIKYKLPDVQIIGAQKAGTTSIAAWLNEKGACPATVFSGQPKYHQKEVHYFDLHSRYRKGIEFYAEHFKDCTHGFRMDATPATFDHSKRVSDAYKQAGGEQHEKLKIIYIVREPVAREFSWYKHMVENYYRDGRDRFHEVTSNDGTVISFDEYVVEYLMPRLKKRQHLDSYYVDTLRKWTSVFDRKQILVLSFDEILDQPEQVEKRICQHIGMCNKASSEGIPHANQKRVAGLRAVSCSVKDQLDIMFDATNNELYNFLDDNSRPHNDNEQHPFPKFQSGTCVPDFAESDSADFENGSR